MTGSLSAGTYMRNLRHVSRRDASLAGEKSATLGELIQADFPGPDGFVLMTAAFERFLSRNSFAADSSPQSVEMGHMPDDVAGALWKAVGDLGNVPLVVRSAGVVEDLPDASFAGQYVTVLDVHGFDAVTHAVKKCWAFTFSEHVVAYRAAHSQHGVAAMAIIEGQRICVSHAEAPSANDLRYQLCGTRPSPRAS